MFRCATVLVSLLAALALALPADAQSFGRNKVRYNQFDFRVLQTDHFDIYYYADEETATRHAARMAERWYARFSTLFNHQFDRRQPLVLYASHPDFSQTNVTPSTPGEGTGGLTERTKSRIAMPFAAGLGATDHVLGHEIAHAFQIDIVKRAGQDAFVLPGWFIEGMAEYLSVGGEDPHTAMWVRDAAANNRLPTLQTLHLPAYSPYRYGHAFWSWVTSRYGDTILGPILRSKVRNPTRRIEAATRTTREELTRQWHEAIGAEGPSQARPATVAAAGAIDRKGARLHVAPALSPDGRRLMFMSERDRLSLDLFMADAQTGAVVQKIVSMSSDPHYDSLQYIHSSGTWNAAGDRFAVAALSGGQPTLVLVNVAQPEDRREITLDDLGEIYNPSWSPDGGQLVFSGLKGGLSDLFVYTVETGSVRQLTADAFADLHPAWSPDGRSIAFTTDRFTSDIDDLQFGALRVGVLDLQSGIIRPAHAGNAGAKQVNPQWAPDGAALYFLSNPDGVSNVYRLELASRTLRRVTDVDGGVTGITATSPALAVASRAGTLAFSVYRSGRYEIQTIDEKTALAAPVVTVEDAPAALPPQEGALARLLSDSAFGLPQPRDYATTAYDDRLRLESIAPPFIGAATSNGFGSTLRAAVGISFADMLRDRQLQATIRVGTDMDDLAMQAAYTNRRGQWNWGVAAGIVPTRFVGARRAIARVQELITRETDHLRYTHSWGKATAHYHLSRTKRFELGAGVRRTGFEWQTITRVINSDEHRTISRSLDETSAGHAIVLGEADAAFVYDTAVSGPTSPLVGQRLRLAVEPAFGGLTFADVQVDARRYLMPIRPVTIAIRAEHAGRYGPDAGDSRLTPLVVALQTRVRGYDLRAFAANECGREATSCSPLDELTGGRLAVLNLELRAPLAGLLSGELSYGRVPVEAIAFLDAGFLWTRRTGYASERDRFRSLGAGARANLGGFVIEAAAARVLDRPDRRWSASILLRPGW
jgi:dipeptidyl aminopeptidase/acylaminoacyl peptidase